MNKQLSLLILSITALILTLPLSLQSAAELPPVETELPPINIKAYQKLYEAATDNDIERARQALEEGADINMYAKYKNKNSHHDRKKDDPFWLPYYRKKDDPFWLPSPLETAATSGYINMVTFLLEHGAWADGTLIHDTPLNRSI